MTIDDLEQPGEAPRELDKNTTEKRGIRLNGGGLPTREALEHAIQSLQSVGEYSCARELKAKYERDRDVLESGH